MISSLHITIIHLKQIIHYNLKKRRLEVVEKNDGRERNESANNDDINKGYFLPDWLTLTQIETNYL